MQYVGAWRRAAYAVALRGKTSRLFLPTCSRRLPSSPAALPARQNRTRPLKIEGLSIEAPVRLDLLARPASLLMHKFLIRNCRHREWASTGRPGAELRLERQRMLAICRLKGRALRGGAALGFAPICLRPGFCGRLAHRAMQLAIACEDLACLKIQR